MKNILFCCWNPSSLGYAVARKTQQQKESSPVGDTSKRIAFLPCRMAMAFVCQPLIAGRQKENLSVLICVISGQYSAFFIFKFSTENYPRARP